MIRSLLHYIERRVVRAEIKRLEAELAAYYARSERILNAWGYPIGSRQFRCYCHGERSVSIYDVKTYAVVWRGESISEALRLASQMNYVWHVGAGRGTVVGDTNPTVKDCTS